MTTETDQLTAVLTRITERLDALEQKIDGLQGGAGLPASAAEPEVRAALERILSRLDTMESALDVADRLGRSVPVVADAIGSVLGEAVRQLQEQGVDLAELAQAGKALGLRAADPEAMELLAQLMSRKDLLRVMVDSADQLEQALADAGTDVAAFARTGTGMAARLAALMSSPEFEAFGRSGAFEPTTIAVVGDASRALVDTRAEQAQPVGFFGMLKAMGDPDVQRAVGFTLAIARRFGRALS